jgi:ribosomal protein S18 acetylase RimI-like enzyme
MSGDFDELKRVALERSDALSYMAALLQSRSKGDPALEFVIRRYDSATDLDALSACIIEQQEFHRRLEPSWPDGQAIIRDYVRYLDAQCTLHNGRIIVAQCSRELVGFVCVVAATTGDAPDDPAPFAWIHDIFVKPAYRRQQLATKLMVEAESFARAQGARQVRLGVLARNEGARQFYRDHGFRDYVSVLTKPLD